MPTYAYRCARCGDEFEVMQSMDGAPLKRCKKCRGALKRVYHPVGIVFKGSGFYKTDSRGSGAKKKTSDDKKGDSKPKKSESTSSSASSD